MHNFTVWVGGGEVNSHYLTEYDANSIAESWRKRGYTEVVVERISNDEVFSDQ